MGDVDEPLPNPLLGEFWVRGTADINADIDVLRSAGGISFHVEPPVPDDYPIPVGPGSWVLSNYADVLYASKTPHIFSSAKGIILQDLPPEFVEFFNSMIAMDDPRHARLRRLVSAGFTPRMLSELEDKVQEVTRTIIDRIVDETDDILTFILMAGQGLSDLMNEVAEAKRGGDGTDLTSVLMNAELIDDQLTPADLASFFILLVVAGNETTRNAISWGLQYLTDNPAQRTMWQENFDELAPQAVEEIVRLASPVLYMRRTVTADTVIGDRHIREGEKVCLSYLLANRDPSVFEDPHAFNILREQKPHVGFGGPGPHYCLGAHLARREINVVFRELFRRVPDIRACGRPEPLFSSFIHGIKHLPAAVHG